MTVLPYHTSFTSQLLSSLQSTLTAYLARDSATYGTTGLLYHRCCSRRAWLELPPVNIAEQRAEVGAEDRRQHVVAAVCQVDGGGSIAGVSVCQAARWNEEGDIGNVYA